MKSDDHLFLCSRCQNAWATIGVKFSAEGGGVYDEVWICSGCMDAPNLPVLRETSKGEDFGEHQISPGQVESPGREARTAE